LAQLYSMLTALFATRLTKDQASRIPSFHKSFAKLVLDGHLITPVPPPLTVLSYPLTILLALPNLLHTLKGTVERRSSRGESHGPTAIRQTALPEPRQTLKRSSLVIRADAAVTKAELMSTPEKRWHHLDYTRKWTTSSLMKYTHDYVAGELLKREGALSASTGAISAQRVAHTRASRCSGVLKPHAARLLRDTPRVLSDPRNPVKSLPRLRVVRRS
jgi:hypothetical protein